LVFSTNSWVIGPIFKSKWGELNSGKFKIDLDSNPETLENFLELVFVPVCPFNLFYLTWHRVCFYY